MTSQDVLTYSACVEWDRRTSIMEDNGDIHHFDFMGRGITCRSATPPAVSLAVVMMGPKKQWAGVSDGTDGEGLREAVVMSEATSFVDPVVVRRPMAELQGLRGERLREAATGACDKFYSGHGSWGYDGYDEDEDVPIFDSMNLAHYDGYEFMPVNGWLQYQSILCRSEISHRSSGLAAAALGNKRKSVGDFKKSPLRNMEVADDVAEEAPEVVCPMEAPPSSSVQPDWPDLDAVFGKSSGNWADDMDDYDDDDNDNMGAAEDVGTVFGKSPIEWSDSTARPSSSSSKGDDEESRGDGTRQAMGQLTMPDMGDRGMVIGHAHAADDGDDNIVAPSAETTPGLSEPNDGSGMNSPGGDDDDDDDNDDDDDDNNNDDDDGEPVDGLSDAYDGSGMISPSDDDGDSSLGAVCINATCCLLAPFLISLILTLLFLRFFLWLISRTKA